MNFDIVVYNEMFIDIAELICIYDITVVANLCIYNLNIKYGTYEFEYQYMQFHIDIDSLTSFLFMI